MRQKIDTQNQSTGQVSNRLNSLDISIKHREEDVIDPRKVDCLQVSVTHDGALDFYPGYYISHSELKELEGRPYIEYTLTAKKSIVMCPYCHCPDTNVHKGYYSTKIHDINLGDIAVFCNVNIERHKCIVCNKSFSIRPIFLHPFRRITNRLYSNIKYRLDHGRGTYSEIAFDYWMSRVTIENIDKGLLSDINTTKNLHDDYEYICMDEHSIHKGQSYVSIAVGVNNNEEYKYSVLFMSLGRKIEDIQPLFDYIKENNIKDKISAFSTDYTSSYMRMVYDELESIVLGDCFHGIKRFGKLVSNFIYRLIKILIIRSEIIDIVLSKKSRGLESRKSILKKYGLSDSDIEELIKTGTKEVAQELRLDANTISENRKLFNLGYEKLIKHEKFSLLKNIINKYNCLFKILMLGDLFRNLWKKGTSPEQSKDYLDKIINECKSIATKSAEAFINFLNKFRSALIYCGIHNVSNSIIEGINSECKVIQRKQHGVKSVSAYILRVIRRFNMRRQEKLFERAWKAKKHEKIA